MRKIIRGVKQIRDKQGHLICDGLPLAEGEGKPAWCIYPDMHRCKWCKYNEVPNCSDGGCKLSRMREGGADDKN